MTPTSGTAHSKTTRSTMRCLKKSVDGPGFQLVADAPVPSLGPTDVLIRVTSAGICGTDRHIHEWDAWARGRVQLGTTIGHEFAGIVEAVGPAVRRVVPGRRVSGEGHITCGHCHLCRTARGHICESVEIIGIDRDGAFAELLVLPEQNVWPLDPSIPDEVGAILDPLGNAVHTVMAADVAARSVLVTGVGTIGLMAVQVARAAGASRILATDTDPRRLEIAKRLGADAVFAATDANWPAAARAVTEGRGPEVLLEMSGSARAISDGLAALQNGGTAALLGLPARPVEIDLAKLVIFKGLRLLGISGRKMFETWFQMEELLRSGRLDPRPLITHRLPLEEHERAFELIRSGEAIKVVLDVARR